MEVQSAQPKAQTEFRRNCTGQVVVVEVECLDIVQFAQDGRNSPLELVVPQGNSGNVRHDTQPAWESSLEFVPIEIEGTY